MNHVIRRNLVYRWACLTALPLALAACGEKEADDKANAAGEILPGSISDSMLPLDTVRSHPPLAPKPSPKGDAGEPTDEADADAEPLDDAEQAIDAAATPAASPAATAKAAPLPAAPAAQQ